jgi:hypothetical protein
MVFRLDYISCVLTVLSTILIGRKFWQGWIVAVANSAIVCVIATRTAQFGFIPANLFCIALYAYNVWNWRRQNVPAEDVSHQSQIAEVAAR